MTLTDALTAEGMIPPNRIVPGRWLRFPGVGKPQSNRAGWCRMITETMAIYGDWSSGLTGLWRDDAHRDDETTARLLQEARARERQFAADQRRHQQEGAQRARELLEAAMPLTHPYLQKKGFTALTGLVYGEHLLIPVRDARTQQLISLQQISPDGEKRFLHGARARGGIHRLGSGQKSFLCEGYVTGMSLYEAARRLHTGPSVIVCFSAGNIEVIAPLFPAALICADHDASGTGERIARKTGLPWVMPPKVDMDFNDLHRAEGLHAVVGVLRGK